MLYELFSRNTKKLTPDSVSVRTRIILRFSVSEVLFEHCSESNRKMLYELPPSTSRDAAPHLLEPAWDDPEPQKTNKLDRKMPQAESRPRPLPELSGHRSGALGFPWPPGTSRDAARNLLDTKRPDGQNHQNHQKVEYQDERRLR